MSAWLACNGVVVASVIIADTSDQRRKGLLGRNEFEGAMLFPRTTSVHTLGMRFAIDVAFLDRDMTVKEMITMKPGRLSKPRRGVYSVLEAKAGAFARWHLEVSSRLEIER